MTLNSDIESLPRRNLDNAYVLDRENHMIKLYGNGRYSEYL